MNKEAFGTTTYCDDIRHEVDGKMTLVGCYAADMNFKGPAPGRLSSFAAVVNFRIPNAIKFRKFKLAVVKEDGDEVTELASTTTDIPPEAFEEFAEGNGDADENEKMFIILAPLKLGGLVMKENGYIKTRAYLDDGPEIRLGSLKVNFSE